MSVLIKGMSKPTDCWDCPLNTGEKCCLHEDLYEYWDEEHENCPLVEIPPHGRLIDADELIALENQHYALIEDDWYVTVRKVELMPTIVPAEVKEE